MAAGYAIVNKDVGRHHPIITEAGTSHHRASRTSPVRQRQYIANAPPIAPSINTHRNNCSITQEYMRHRFSRMNADYPSCSVKICGSFWTISFAFGRMPLEVPQRARLACSLHVDGPIAQSVEQLAFNQWVAGSSPARLTIGINNKGQPLPIEALPYLFYVRPVSVAATSILHPTPTSPSRAVLSSAVRGFLRFGTCK